MFEAVSWRNCVWCLLFISYSCFTSTLGFESIVLSNVLRVPTVGSNSCVTGKGKRTNGIYSCNKKSLMPWHSVQLSSSLSMSLSFKEPEVNGHHDTNGESLSNKVDDEHIEVYGHYDTVDESLSNVVDVEHIIATTTNTLELDAMRSELQEKDDSLERATKGLERVISRNFELEDALTKYEIEADELRESLESYEREAKSQKEKIENLERKLEVLEKNSETIKNLEKKLERLQNTKMAEETAIPIEKKVEVVGKEKAKIFFLEEREEETKKKNIAEEKVVDTKGTEEKAMQEVEEAKREEQEEASRKKKIAEEKAAAAKIAEDEAKKEVEVAKRKEREEEMRKKKIEEEKAAAAKIAEDKAKKEAEVAKREEQEEELRKKKIADESAAAVKTAAEKEAEKAKIEAEREELRKKKMFEEKLIAARKEAMKEAEEAERKEAALAKERAKAEEEKRIAMLKAAEEKREQQRQKMLAAELKRRHTRKEREQRAAEKKKAEAEAQLKEQMKPILTIMNNWQVTSEGKLTGTVQGHPSIPDGDLIETSPLVNPAEATRQGAVVATASGTEYTLGVPSPAAAVQGKKISTTTFVNRRPSNGVKQRSVSERDVLAEAYKQAVKDLGLTGFHIGEGKSAYLLAGKARWSTAGRSQVWTAYHADEDGLPQGEALAVKISDKSDMMSRENENYIKVTNPKKRGMGTFNFGRPRGSFVVQHDFLPVAGGTFDKPQKLCALVMERGDVDLREYLLNQGNVGMKGNTLREAAMSIAKCIEAIHSKKMVWTDLKTENFIVCGDDGTSGETNGAGASISVKGIDLESARPFKGHPLDYSPEACPPEFAEAFNCGEGLDFVLDYSYDIWSYGMLLYELATGYGYFDGKVRNPSGIMEILPTLDPSDDGNFEEIKDKALSDLIFKCLSTNPKKRPSIQQILLHPYLILATPFSFI